MSNQNLLSPNQNDPCSGRSTPSSVGGTTSGRSSALTVESSGAISFGMQTNALICPIPLAGSFAVIDPDGLAAIGREKGSGAYSAVEHVALLSIIFQVPGAFNCCESSPQWEEVHRRMNTAFYQSGGTRLSSALHGHFLDLYRAFKLGIRNLSLVDKVNKCTLEYEAGDDVMDEYVEALHNLLWLDRSTIQRSGVAAVLWSCSSPCI
jgi:hypothetical protein